LSTFVANYFRSRLYHAIRRSVPINELSNDVPAAVVGTGVIFTLCPTLSVPLSLSSFPFPHTEAPNPVMKTVRRNPVGSPNWFWGWVFGAEHGRRSIWCSLTVKSRGIWWHGRPRHGQGALPSWKYHQVLLCCKCCL